VDPPGPQEVILRMGDILRISVWPDSTLGGDYAISETGAVYLPVLGRVQAADRSIEALRTELSNGYLSAMREPVVNITPLFRVTAIGAVMRPGIYWIDPTQNLFDVIGEAGGFSDQAKEDGVRVIRGEVVFEINASDITTIGETALGLQPQSGDRIVVPRKSRLNFASFLTMAQTGAIVVSILTR